MSRAAETVDHWLRQAGPTGDPGFAISEAGRFVLATSLGLVRRDNQDRVLLARYLPLRDQGNYFTLVAICDGMGGGIEGARCAEIALCTVIEGLLTNDSGELENSMLEAVVAANSAIGQAFKNRGGTTFTGLLHTRTDNLFGVHVGDSRAYSIDPDSGEPTQLTEDHNLAARMAASEGNSGDPDAYQHLANQLTQCLGMKGDVSPQCFELDASGGESLLLTTDGLHCIRAEEIKAITEDSQNLEGVAERLIEASHQLGGVDNASLALVHDLARAWGEPGVLELHCPGLADLHIGEDEL